MLRKIPSQINSQEASCKSEEWLSNLILDFSQYEEAKDSLGMSL